MNPHERWCHNRRCRAYGRPGEGHIVIHSKTLSENFSVDLEQRRISPRMDSPIVTVLKGDAPYERAYHNQQRGLL
jgi:hypothetical protein